jgi:hypothetical protein
MKRAMLGCSVILGLSVLAPGASASAATASTKPQLHDQAARCEIVVKGHAKVTKTNISACKAAHLQVNVRCKSASGATVVNVNKVNYALRVGRNPVKVTSCLMPNVTGQRLDAAESNLQRAGLDPTKITIVGGGTFGVVVKSHWTVCTQTPGPGKEVSSAPRLKVDRTCEPQQTTVPTTSTTTSQPSTPTTATDQVDASAAEKAYLAHLAADYGVQSIEATCDAAYTLWSCFYAGVTNGLGYLQVNLTTDGGWSESDLDVMANEAGRAWFISIGCDFPNLSTIVVTINGIDHNVFRSDTEDEISC